MSERTHDAWLDDVAVYALGSMAAAEAVRVREHLAECAECRDEYAALAPATAALGIATQARPSDLLKARVMRAVRGEMRAAPEPPPVWPAYLVAAACFAIALATSIYDVSVLGQLKQTQSRLANLQERAAGLTGNLANEETTISDLLDGDARRYPVADGEVVRRGQRLYIAMHDLANPPRGKVYQAWTLPAGSKTMRPSLTFVPDAHGVAVIALPVDARSTNAVAVSLEPEGGSKQPTSKPLILVPLD